MILVFETNRTRSIDSVTLPGAQSLRDRYHSRDPKVAADARIEMAVLAPALENGISAIESILGRPYYELLYFPLNSVGTAIEGIRQSVDATTDDIINEAVRLMALLHVRPYIFWTSETELMIAAARPGSSRGPWDRQDIEQTAPLMSAVDCISVGSDRTGLIEWCNARRTAYEPGCDWDVIAADDARLRDFLSTLPDLRKLLDGEAWTDDDRELMRGLVRLGRLGYGVPSVRKPPYRDVHLLS